MAREQVARRDLSATPRSWRERLEDRGYAVVDMMITAWLTLAIVACAPLSADAGCERPAAPAARTLVVAAANVRLRAEPSVEVRILATLPLGTELAELERHQDGTWVRVRTPDGTDGWIHGTLTRVLPSGPGARNGVLDTLIRERLNARAGFEAGVQLVAFIERLQAEPATGERAAQLALWRLQAVTAAAGATADRRFYGRTTPAEEAWLAVHDGLLVWNGGNWLLRREAILGEHARHRGTRAAVQIAWLVVTAGLPGECETDIGCAVRNAVLLEGEFLREYPSGAFAGTALGRLVDRALEWTAILDDWKAVTADEACAGYREPLATLRAIVDRVRPSRGDGPRHALLRQLLQDLARRCG